MEQRPAPHDEHSRFASTVGAADSGLWYAVAHDHSTVVRHLGGEMPLQLKAVLQLVLLDA